MASKRDLQLTCQLCGSFGDKLIVLTPTKPNCVCFLANVAFLVVEVSSLYLFESTFERGKGTAPQTERIDVRTRPRIRRVVCDVDEGMIVRHYP